MIGTTDTDRNGQTFTRVAVKLGSGKVHYAHKYDGWGVSPQCGGNRASERYRVVNQDVDCKRCLKLLAAEEAAEQAHRDRVDASMQPATGEGDYLAPAAPATEVAEVEQPAPAAEVEQPAPAERWVSVDMQNKTQGVVIVHGPSGLQGLIGADGDGGLYAENPYGETVWHRDGFVTITDAADSLARSDGFAGTVRITVTHEYSDAVPVTSTTEAQPEIPEPEAPSVDAEIEQLETAREAVVRQLAGIDARLAELRPGPQTTEVRIVMEDERSGTVRLPGCETAVVRHPARYGDRWSVLGYGISGDSLEGLGRALACRLGIAGPVTVTVVQPRD